MKRIVIVVGLMAALLLPSTAMANGQTKHYICHRTASETNPYVLIHVATPAKVQAHLSGQGKGHFRTRVGSDFLPTEWQIRNRTCGDQPPPPPENTWKPAAWVRVCADPRLIIRLNNKGTLDARYSVTFKSAKTRQFVTFNKVVRGKTSNLLAPRWVVGRSRVTITAYPTNLPQGVVVPAVMTTVYDRILPRSTPWGQGYCPDSLRVAKQNARLR